MYGQSEVQICGPCGNSAPMDIVVKWKNHSMEYDEKNRELSPQSIRLKNRFTETNGTYIFN